VRLNTEKIRALGWLPELNSRDAIRRSLGELVADERTFVQ
jgi:hypothetical protein